MEQGALIEPMSVAVMAVSKIGQMPHAANVVGRVLLSSGSPYADFGL
jgi:hypothetical protein